MPDNDAIPVDDITLTDDDNDTNPSDSENDSEVTTKEVTDPSKPSKPGYEYVDTDPNSYEEEDEEWQELYAQNMTYDDYDDFVSSLEKDKNVYKANGNRMDSGNDIEKITNNVCGIFGMPYQFSQYVDPVMDELGSTTSTNIGRKYSQKILSVMPVLFLTPGEPLFMGKKDGLLFGGKKSKANLASQIFHTLNGEDQDEIDEDGRYYTFAQNFNEYRKYANTALRALAFFMGIQDMRVPIPGKDKDELLSALDITHFMSNDFTKLFGTHCVVPFYLDAETSISEDFSNDTTESMISQTANGFSQTAREIQFIMGSKDPGGLLKAMGSAVTDIGTNFISAAGDLSDALVGKNLLSRLTGELTTIVSGGKIVFPEIWSGSSYSKSYNINLKLRSPDPDPVSIFLNIYMPIILLVSMAAPRQINAKSNSYESPFLVRATYKSIFNCDLGIIQSLSITKGGSDRWNVMGQPYTADVSITLKDLYSDMFISKMMGLIANTAQMDYLATMAGVNLNDFEIGRLMRLGAMIIGDAPRDYVTDFWGGISSGLAQTAAGFLGNFADVRSLGW